MIHNEGWLDQFFLTELLEEEVYDITLLVAFFVFYISLFGKCFCFLIGCYFVKFDAGVFLDALCHRHSGKWLSKVNFCSLVGDCG